jgi:hypothetical protein
LGISKFGEIIVMAARGSDPSWADTWAILRDVMTPYGLYLDTYERDVLNFIFLRTRLYRKEWESIPIKHFKNGVFSADGNLVAPPVDVSEPKIWECLKHLKGKGIVEVRSYPGTSNPNMYRIRGDAEIDREHVVAYTRRYQRSLNERMQAKVLQAPAVQALLEGATSKFLGTPTQNTEVAPTKDAGVLNSQNFNNPIFNPAAMPPPTEVLVPVRLRKIQINKK